MTVAAPPQRWWAPGDGPRPEDMLKPGPDPQKDLGLAFLAVHKAGAEACDLVSKTAVADEYVLATAIAETRALIAPLAVEPIAKAVGGPAYAGLLLKDLLDDAEVAALALYRTCLAKSVAPPIAAQRVGMVFGVPSRELGQYAILATDPKANPVAVADAADRALFAYSAKLVSEEYQPEPELVSKARTEDNPATAYWDARESGRFAPRTRTKDEVMPGVSLQQLFDQAEQETVATTPAAQSSGPEVGERRAPRQMRQMRRARRAPRAEQAPKAKQAAPKQAVRRQAASRQAAGKQATRKQRAQQQLAKLVPPTPAVLARMQRDVNMTARRPDVETHPVLKDDISFILPYSEYLHMTRKGKQAGRGQSLVRAGAVAEWAGEPRLLDSDDHVTGLQQVRDLEASGEQLHDVPGEKDVVAVAIDLSDLEDDVAKSQRLEKMKGEIVRQWAGAVGARVNVNQFIAMIAQAPDPDNPDVVHLVMARPVNNGGRWEARNVPHLVEVIVPGNTLRGQVTAQGVKIDQNQVLRASSAYREDETFSVHWDSSLQAVVITSRLQGATEHELVDDERPFGKASRYLDEHNVRNDPRTGRFVPEADVLPGVSLQGLFDQAAARQEEAAVPRAPRRMARARRLPRATAVAPRQAAGKQTARQQQARPQQAKRQLTRRQAALKQVARAPREHDEDLAPLVDGFEYNIVSDYEFRRTAAEVGDDAGTIYADDTPRWMATAFLRRLVTRVENAQYGAVDADMARSDAIGVSLDDWSTQAALSQSTASSAELEQLIAQHDVADTEDVEHLASAIAARMKADPTLVALRAELVQSRGGARLRIFSNAQEMPDVHVLRYAEDADPDRPTRITHLGRKRLIGKQAIAQWLELVRSGQLDGDAGLANPHVRTWRVD